MLRESQITACLLTEIQWDVKILTFIQETGQKECNTKNNITECQQPINRWWVFVDFLRNTHFSSNRQSIPAICTHSQLTCCVWVLALQIQKSKPPIFQHPRLLTKIDSGQMLLWIRWTLLWRKPRPSIIYSSQPISSRAHCELWLL